MDLQSVLDLCGIVDVRACDLTPEGKQSLWDSIKSFAEPLIRQSTQHPLKFYKPTPKQGDFLKTVRSEVKQSVAKGGNRTGKTHIGALTACVYLLGKDYFIGSDLWEYIKDIPVPADRGRTIWAVGVDFDAGIKSVIWPKLKMFLPKGDFPGLVWRDYDKTVEYTDSKGHTSVLRCKSAESGRTKFQGASVDLIWEDEEIPEDVHDECYQRTIDCSGHIIITCTPIGEEGKVGTITWLYDLYERCLAGERTVAFTSFSIFDNPYLPPAEVQAAVDKWSGRPEGRARLYGDFYQALGMCFYELEPSVHFVRPYQIPKDWLHFRVIDPHPAKATACLWLACDYFNDLHVYREYSQQGIASDHAKAITATSESAGERIDFTLIDPKGGNQKNAESHRTIAQIYRENGLFTLDGIADVDFRVAKVNEYLRATKDKNSRHPKIHIFDTLLTLRHQMSRYRQDVFTSGAKKGEPKGKPVEVDDDFCDCIGYACARQPRSKQQRSTPQPRHNSYT
jgi:phage terminase large subunit-like protein